MKRFSSILVIPDQHFPFNHPDIISFLKAVAKKYKPDKVINLGDEVDLHAFSFHEKHPDLMSPGDELKTAINRLKPLYELFPEVDVCESNHGSLVYRRGKFAGLPRNVIKSYNEILEAPKGWKWHHEIEILGGDGEPILFCHGLSADALKNSKNKSMRFVQGHHHSKFEIRYWANSQKLYWGMSVGCLIDYKSLAYEYARLVLDKPIIGCAVILNGYPILIPMILRNDGRWTGVLP